jgi:hypothetical protein
MYNIINSLEELIHTLLKYIFHKLVLTDLYWNIKVDYLQIRKYHKDK